MKKLRDIMIQMLELAGPDNCSDELRCLMEDALAITKNEKAPWVGAALLNQAGLPRPGNHPG
ncbi:hypothetical protein [Aeromonas sobria]|uniref:hypothetical protein n=1 Tax=Aeromonas sobria TaxID=646 RepID=UPI0026EF13C5|nr:hypothetical protein [Aeromonas sobria]